MADDTRIYIDKADFDAKLGNFDNELNKLTSLLENYKQLQTNAKRVWGDADENQAKALAACASAIAVVEKRIEQTKADRNALNSLNELAFNKQKEFGSDLEAAKSITDALLG